MQGNSPVKTRAAGKVKGNTKDEEIYRQHRDKTSR